jgi:hypothetical protein
MPVLTKTNQSIIKGIFPVPQIRVCKCGSGNNFEVYKPISLEAVVVNVSAAIIAW